jgi:hypothetical protein
MQTKRAPKPVMAVRSHGCAGLNLSEPEITEEEA